MPRAKRQMFLFALGYFMVGAYLVSFVNTGFQNYPSVARSFNTWVGWLAIAYIIVAFTFNVIDRRRTK